MQSCEGVPRIFGKVASHLGATFRKCYLSTGGIRIKCTSITTLDFANTEAFYVNLGEALLAFISRIINWKNLCEVGSKCHDKDLNVHIFAF